MQWSRFTENQIIGILRETEAETKAGEMAVKTRAEAVEQLVPITDRLRALKASELSVRAIAARLKDAGVKPLARGAWHSSSVDRALQQRLHQ